MKFTERQAAAWTQIREQFEGHIENVNGPDVDDLLAIQPDTVPDMDTEHA